MPPAKPSYCSFSRARSDHHRHHHDFEHGRLPRDDDDLFRRLVLEISQAGLSFDTVLKKKKAIYAAFPSVEKVSRYKEKDVRRLLANPGIIRNRLKIEAAIYNARKIQEIQKRSGSFKNWLGSQGKLSLAAWVKLFRKNFRFTGPQIANEFLVSCGYLPGAHDADCPVAKAV